METRSLSWVSGIDAAPRSLWGQIMVGDMPWGEPFQMVAEPASRGMATFKTPDVINLQDAPDSGQLRVTIWSADYGILGTSNLDTVGGPVTEGCTVAVTSIVVGPE